MLDRVGTRKVVHYDGRGFFRLLHLCMAEVPRGLVVLTVFKSVQDDEGIERRHLGIGFELATPHVVEPAEDTLSFFEIVDYVGHMALAVLRSQGCNIDRKAVECPSECGLTLLDIEIDGNTLVVPRGEIIGSCMMLEVKYLEIALRHVGMRASWQDLFDAT